MHVGCVSYLIYMYWHDARCVRRHCICICWHVLAHTRMQIYRHMCCCLCLRMLHEGVNFTGTDGRVILCVLDLATKVPEVYQSLLCDPDVGGGEADR